MEAYFTGIHVVAVFLCALSIDASVLQEISVQLQLHFGQGHIECFLYFRRQAEFKILFGSPLEKGVDYFVEVFCHFELKVEFLLFVALCILDAFFDFVEEVAILEYFGHYEEEETPKLLEVVIEGSARH